MPFAGAGWLAEPADVAEGVDGAALALVLGWVVAAALDFGALDDDPLFAGAVSIFDCRTSEKLGEPGAFVPGGGLAAGIGSGGTKTSAIEMAIARAALLKRCCPDAQQQAGGQVPIF